jgi:hypothetical protein
MGVYTISIALSGIPLPGSPFTINATCGSGFMLNGTQCAGIQKNTVKKVQKKYKKSTKKVQKKYKKSTKKVQKKYKKSTRKVQKKYKKKYPKKYKTEEITIRNEEER